MKIIGKVPRESTIRFICTEAEENFVIAISFFCQLCEATVCEHITEMIERISIKD